MDGATIGLLVLALAELGWLVLHGVVVRSYQPAPVPHAPMTSTLRDEPPAVVNLLAHGGELSTEVVPAVVLDLAARNLLAIEPVGPDEEVIRLRPKGEMGKLLRPHERLVVDHLRKQATQHVVPRVILRTGPAMAGSRWWRRFRRAVTAEARRHRLVRARYPLAVVAVLGVTVPLLALLTLLFVTDSGVGDDAGGDPAWWAFGAAAVGLTACAVTLWRFPFDAVRLTRAGREVAAHWLGVHDAYAEADHDALPPTAVDLYGRHLAYAAALGTARACVARLPLGCEDGERAWSRRDGAWRLVRVHYPRWRAAWGRRPERAVLGGALWSLLLLVPLIATASHGSDLYAASRAALERFETADDPANPLTPERLRWIAIAMSMLATALLTTVTVAGVRRGVLPLVRGILDLGPRRTRRGIVVRRRDVARTIDDRVVSEPFVAVDDGRRSTVTAYRLAADLALLVDQGDEVELSVTRHLGHVGALRDLHKAPARPAPVPPRRLAPPAVPALTPGGARRSARR